MSDSRTPDFTQNASHYHCGCGSVVKNTDNNIKTHRTRNVHKIWSRERKRLLLSAMTGAPYETQEAPRTGREMLRAEAAKKRKVRIDAARQTLCSYRAPLFTMVNGGPIIPTYTDIPGAIPAPGGSRKRARESDISTAEDAETESDPEMERSSNRARNSAEGNSRSETNSPVPTARNNTTGGSVRATPSDAVADLFRSYGLPISERRRLTSTKPPPLSAETAPLPAASLPPLVDDPLVTTPYEQHLVSPRERDCATPPQNRGPPEVCKPQNATGSAPTTLRSTERKDAIIDYWEKYMAASCQYETYWEYAFASCSSVTRTAEERALDRYLADLQILTLAEQKCRAPIVIRSGPDCEFIPPDQILLWQEVARGVAVKARIMAVPK